MEQGWAEPTIQGKPSPGLVHSTATGTAPTEPSGSGGVTSPALTDAKANAVRKHPPAQVQRQNSDPERQAVPTATASPPDAPTSRCDTAGPPAESQVYFSTCFRGFETHEAGLPRSTAAPLAGRGPQVRTRARRRCAGGLRSRVQPGA